MREEQEQAVQQDAKGVAIWRAPLELTQARPRKGRWRRTFWTTNLACALWLVILLLPVVQGVEGIVQVHWLKSQGVHLQGRITRMWSVPHTKSAPSYHAAYTYDPPLMGEKQHEHFSGDALLGWRDVADLTVGDEVEVVYERDHPRHAMLEIEKAEVLREGYFLPALMLVPALFSLFVGLLLWAVWSKAWRERRLFTHGKVVRAQVSLSEPYQGKGVEYVDLSYAFRVSEGTLINGEINGLRSEAARTHACLATVLYDENAIANHALYPLEYVAAWVETIVVPQPTAAQR